MRWAIALSGVRTTKTGLELTPTVVCQRPWRFACKVGNSGHSGCGVEPWPASGSGSRSSLMLTGRFLRCPCVAALLLSAALAVVHT